MDGSNDGVKFVVDVMLGRLATYLLLLGYDCEYRREFPDNELLEFAEAEDRKIITRDAGLATECLPPKVCYLKSIDLSEQLKIVKNKFSLRFLSEQLFTRCTDCNELLKRTEKDNIKEEIPSQTRDWLDIYYFCPQCEKIYWRGTHYRAVKERLENWNLLDE